MSWLRVVLALGLCSASSLAGVPNYGAFCDREGHIGTEQQVLAAQEMVRDPEQLETVYADALRGNRRAARVFRELESIHFPNIGREVAERVSRPECLVPVYRELSGTCIPNWAFLDFLRKDTQAGIRLRKALFDAFTIRARERGLQNQLILAGLNAVLGVSIAASVARPGLAATISASTARGASTTLYRAVSEVEFHQVMKTGRFAVAPNTLEGKFFAETVSDAAKWGERLQGRGNFRIVEVKVPTTTADQLMRWERLDGIGPARYAELDQLTGVTVREAIR